MTNKKYLYNRRRLIKNKSYIKIGLERFLEKYPDYQRQKKILEDLKNLKEIHPEFRQSYLSLLLIGEGEEKQEKESPNYKNNKGRLRK